MSGGAPPSGRACRNGRPGPTWGGAPPRAGGPPLGAGVGRAEDPAPHGVVRLLGREVHAGVEGERLIELLAALALAARGAIDERRVLVGIDPVALGQALLDRALQGLQRLIVLAVLVLLQARAQGLLRLGRLEQLLHFAHRLGLAAGQRGERDQHQQSGHFWNLCLILMASPAFTFTFSTWLGNVELRISIVCEPAGISSVRSGGLTPRLLPSTRTSPHGSTASSTRAGSADAAVLSFGRSGFFSSRATSFLSNLPSTAAAEVLLGAAGAEDSSMVLAATAAPITRKNASGAASSAERRRPSGPMPASQPPSRACTIDSVC